MRLLVLRKKTTTRRRPTCGGCTSAYERAAAQRRALHRTACQVARVRPVLAVCAAHTRAQAPHSARTGRGAAHGRGRREPTCGEAESAPLGCSTLVGLGAASAGWLPVCLHMRRDVLVNKPTACSDWPPAARLGCLLWLCTCLPSVRPACAVACSMCTFRSPRARRRAPVCCAVFFLLLNQAACCGSGNGAHALLGLWCALDCHARRDSGVTSPCMHAPPTPRTRCMHAGTCYTAIAASMVIHVHPPPAASSGGAQRARSVTTYLCCPRSRDAARARRVRQAVHHAMQSSSCDAVLGRGLP